jgi:archaellum component FlaC
MTIDERLERLTERHEALAQSLELLTQDVRQLAQKVDKMGGIVDDTLTGIARLLHVAEIHERRITRLEEAD